MKPFILALVSFFLSGCMNVATTGVQALYHHKTLQKSMKDQLASMQVNQAIKKEAEFFKDTNIVVVAYQGDLLITGEVPNVLQRQRVENIAHKVENINRVYNFLEVDYPISSVTSMHDTWLTAKIKSRLIASDDLDASEVKVVTENGTAYLMGVLQPSDAEAAVEIARTTSGVNHVVKIFSYMHISRK